MSADRNYYDVIVIGAGAAGLSAALDLVSGGKKVILLEARDRVGGRIHTVMSEIPASFMELGAEFIHGHLDRTLQLLTRAGMEKKNFEGSFWKHEKGSFTEAGEPVENSEDVLQKLSALKEDMPVTEFIDRHLQGPEFEKSRSSITNYVSGYSAADPSRASSLALLADLQTSEQDQYRPESGYGQLVDYLAKELKTAGVTLLLSHPVERIEWSRRKVTVYANGACWESAQVLVTIPVGLLQKEAIHFQPALPQITEAAKALGFGNVIKVVMHFKTAFWEDPAVTGGADLKDLGFLFSQEAVPTWWSGDSSQGPCLTGWLAGSLADPYLEEEDDELMQLAQSSLMRIFNISKESFQENLLQAVVVNWHRDPYSRGAYSYAVPGDRAARNLIGQGVEGTIFFAGEALHEGPEIGTVEAALATGGETARQILNG